jgi:flagellin
VSGNTIQAQKILSTAIRQVATLRGRLGALQKNVLDTNVSSLSVALENVTASESDIRDADFASETAALTRAQILVQANTSVLAQANSSPQSVLSLLGR